MRLLPQSDGRSRPPALSWALAFSVMLGVLAACSDSATDPITVTTVVVTPTDGDVQVGSTLQLSAEARSSGGQVGSNPTVDWQTDNGSVATVSQNGMVQGVAPGTARITATVESVSASVDVAVFDLPEVETLPATDVTASSGVTPGRVNPGGAPTEWTVELGLSPLLLNEQCTVNEPPLTGVDDVMVGCPITGQPEGRTIFYRVVAENKAGRAEGVTMSFTTSAGILASVDGDIHWSVMEYSVDTAAETLRISRSSGNNVRNAVMEFDLGGVPAGVTVTAARLRVTTAGLVSNIGAVAPLHLHAFAGDGAITSDDHEREEPGTLMKSLSVPTGGGTPIGTVLTFEMEDLNALQAILDGGAGHLALRLQTEDFATITIHSLRSETPGITRPTLEFQYE